MLLFWYKPKNYPNREYFHGGSQKMEKSYVANLKEETLIELSSNAVDAVFTLLRSAVLAASRGESKDISDDLLTMRFTLIRDEVHASDIGNLSFHEQSGKVFMMTLQNCLIKQTNIKGAISELRFVDVEGKLVVTNPPSLKIQDLVKVLEEA